MLRVLVCALLLAALMFAQDASLVRVPEADAKKAVASKVDPEYPSIARQMKLSGRVVVDVVIDETGKVENAKPVSGNQLLSGAAVAAVKKWKFNSFDKKVVTSLAFDFKL